MHNQDLSNLIEEKFEADRKWILKKIEEVYKKVLKHYEKKYGPYDKKKKEKGRA